jgi:8-oxo-dGTP diphosphatase
MADATPELHDWLVAGGVIETDGGLLLVRNRRRGGLVDWSTPGGVIDPGEDLLTGLTREVREETGLVVSEWHGPLYEIRVEAPDMGWRLRVEAHLALAYDGCLAVDDPDGIVDEACFVARSDWPMHLDGSHPWVREPLTEWLEERWEGRRDYGYQVAGADPRSAVVTRL